MADQLDSIVYTINDPFTHEVRYVGLCTRGEQRFKELQKSLSGKDNVLRTKILVEINEDFHQADKINVALDDNILQELVKCFKE